MLLFFIYSFSLCLPFIFSILFVASLFLLLLQYLFVSLSFSPLHNFSFLFFHSLSILYIPSILIRSLCFPLLFQYLSIPLNLPLLHLSHLLSFIPFSLFPPIYSILHFLPLYSFLYSPFIPLSLYSSLYHSFIPFSLLSPFYSTPSLFIPFIPLSLHSSSSPSPFTPPLLFYSIISCSHHTSFLVFLPCTLPFIPFSLLPTLSFPSLYYPPFYSTLSLFLLISLPPSQLLLAPPCS